MTGGLVVVAGKRRVTLRERDEILLGIVRERTEFKDGVLSRFYVPTSESVMVVYGVVLPGHGTYVSGTDGSRLRKMERLGLLARQALCGHAYAATARGIEAYEEVARRTRAAEARRADDGVRDLDLEGDYDGTCPGCGAVAPAPCGDTCSADAALREDDDRRLARRGGGREP